jgi:hypothetical protein
MAQVVSDYKESELKVILEIIVHDAVITHKNLFIVRYFVMVILVQGCFCYRQYYLETNNTFFGSAKKIVGNNTSRYDLC